MAIHFISGKPGGGKSLFAVRQIISELRNGNKIVVTNVPLLLPRLNEYLQETFPKDPPIDLFTRVRMLSDDQIKTFWEFRGPDGFGVLYAIDEIHLHFNAREWMKTGAACLHYISQHRKFGDTLLCITQFVGNVDKQFRSIAQDFSVIRNEYMSKFGIFRGRSRFLRRTYEFFHPDGGRQIPFETASFTIDIAGVASCYETCAGVGIEPGKGGGDKLKPAKGVSIWALVPVFACVAALVFFMPKILQMTAKDLFTADLPERQTKAPPGFRSSMTDPVDVVQSRTENPAAMLHSGVMTGFQRIGGVVTVYLQLGNEHWAVRSDRPEDGLEGLTRTFAIVNGLKYPMKRPGSVPLQHSPTSSAPKGGPSGVLGSI